MNDNTDPTKQIPVYGRDIKRKTQPSVDPYKPGPIAIWFGRIFTAILGITVLGIVAIAGAYILVELYKSLFN